MHIQEFGAREQLFDNRAQTLLVEASRHGCGVMSTGWLWASDGGAAH